MAQSSVSDGIGSDSAAAPAAAPDLGDTATFLLKKNGKVQYVVINGYVHDVNKPFKKIGNGIVE